MYLLVEQLAQNYFKTPKTCSTKSYVKGKCLLHVKTKRSFATKQYYIQIEYYHKTDVSKTGGESIKYLVKVNALIQCHDIFQEDNIGSAIRFESLKPFLSNYQAQYL